MWHVYLRRIVLAVFAIFTSLLLVTGMVVLNTVPVEADENVYYWLEDEIEEWNFESITEDTLFYLNKEEQLVISFNEGDVAPMYMGVVEFVVPDEVVKDVLR